MPLPAAALPVCGHSLLLGTAVQALDPVDQKQHFSSSFLRPHMRFPMSTTPKARVVDSSENRLLPKCCPQIALWLPNACTHRCVPIHAHTGACPYVHTYIYKMKGFLYVLIYFSASVYAHHVCAVPREARRRCWTPLELELRGSREPYNVSAGSQTRVLSKRCAQLLSHLSCPKDEVLL